MTPKDQATALIELRRTTNNYDEWVDAVAEVIAQYDAVIARLSAALEQTRTQAHADHEQKYNLKLLRNAAEIACREAIACQTLTGEAVNWGDLHCTAAEYTVDDAGNAYHAVRIEEASPDAEGLALFISERLEAQGFPGIAVHLEW